eukprot:3338173-Alexandrium_andersonii.AAC.1
MSPTDRRRATFYPTGDRKTSEPPRLWPNMSYLYGPSWGHISLCMRRASTLPHLQRACLALALCAPASHP